MAYATPSDMLRYFGESELAQIAAPEDETVTASDITDMIRGNNSGYSSSEADADPLNRLQEALDDASMLIDSYLAGRYATPATDTNATEVLRRPCAELARCDLYVNGAPEDMVKRCDDIKAWLRDISKGLVSLPFTDNDDEKGSLSSRHMLRVS